MEDYDYADQHEDYGDLAVTHILGEDQSMSVGEGSGYVDKDAREQTLFTKPQTVGIYPDKTFNVTGHRTEDTVTNTESPFEDEYDGVADVDFDHEDTTEIIPTTVKEDSFEDIISGEDIIIGRDYDVGKYHLSSYHTEKFSCWI